MSSPLSELERAVLWRRTDEPGGEYLEVYRGEGWRLAGTIVLALEGQPARARYTVRCDDGRRTREVEVVLTVAGLERELRLTADGEGRWWRDGAEQPELSGCLDVDLEITPATNTLPIRRLGLTLGEASEVRAAWVRFPSLAVEVLPQRYARVDEHTYAYSSGDFRADLETDNLGLLTRYEGLWERVTVSSGG